MKLFWPIILGLVGVFFLIVGVAGLIVDAPQLPVMRVKNGITLLCGLLIFCGLLFIGIGIAGYKKNIL